MVAEVNRDETFFHLDNSWEIAWHCITNQYQEKKTQYRNCLPKAIVRYLLIRESQRLSNNYRSRTIELLSGLLEQFLFWTDEVVSVYLQENLNVFKHFTYVFSPVYQHQKVVSHFILLVPFLFLGVTVHTMLAVIYFSPNDNERTSFELETAREQLRMWCTDLHCLNSDGCGVGLRQAILANIFFICSMSYSTGACVYL